MSYIQEIMTAVVEVEKRDQVPLGIRLGETAFHRVVEEAAPPGASDSMRELSLKSHRFARLVREADERRSERLRAGHAAWGKDGSMLFGYPIRCDPGVRSFSLVLPEDA